MPLQAARQDLGGRTRRLSQVKQGSRNGQLVPLPASLNLLDKKNSYMAWKK
jgi:hypothetical protein